MRISLKWIGDFVELPAALDPRELVERFTRTTAEVERVEHVAVDARGLVAARVERVEELPGTQGLRRVVLALGSDHVQTISAAPVLHLGWNVVYAPVGASVKALGEIKAAEVAGEESRGMILPGDALGMPLVAREAVYADPSFTPGTAIDPELFDDWVIEVDNKSLTHRPDLWGHYGIAREIAAMSGVSLAPLPMEPEEDLRRSGEPAIPIAIADAGACRRYSGLVLRGVATRAAPLWMQLRLGRVGMRPISALVDLTNYVMADLGQPMHAFDAGKVDRIEVDWADDGALFRTLDGVERRLSADTLMIKSGGSPIALAGVMGGLETEVSESTDALLLESANFDPANIRRTATRLGLRTDASTRFEKSLDPTNTVLAMRRFIRLARPIFSEMSFASNLSDCYPVKRGAVQVAVNPRHVQRCIGRTVSYDEASAILTPLGMSVAPDGDRWQVHVPSHRATNDISIEADVVEELARFIGYDHIPPVMPVVTVRNFPPNGLHELERNVLAYFAGTRGFQEIHGYIWYDSEWLDRLGYEPRPCNELKNPAAAGQQRLRRSLMPGILAATAKNRFHFSALNLIEVGSVCKPGDSPHERRHAAFVAASRGKNTDTSLFYDLKGAIEGWAWHCFGRRPRFEQVDPAPDRPWEQQHRTATVQLGDGEIGRLGQVDRTLRMKMDEHLGAWGIAWAELSLSSLDGIEVETERLGGIPNHPVVEMDFSFVIPRHERYGVVEQQISRFRHDLLRSIRYVGSFEGAAVGAGVRSVTVRTAIGSADRTLTEQDAAGFRRAFEGHLNGAGFEIRR